MPSDLRQSLLELLKEYVDIFAWSYRDMPGLDSDIVKHKLPLHPQFSSSSAAVEENEIGSGIKDQGRIRKAMECQIPYYSRMPSMGRKHSANTQEGWEGVNVCQLQEPQKANPKDNFSLPHIDMLVDNTVQHAFFPSWTASLECPQWVENIVPIPKKDGKEPQKANPKDNFSLPHIDMLVDNTVQHAFFPSWTASLGTTKSGWH
ncbi:hypothetical protein CR513_03047, partial [Mucuna pruriens]